jgi:hypothetical protein
MQQSRNVLKLVKSQSIPGPTLRKACESAQRVCVSLTVHPTIEEETFYPTAREMLEDENLMDTKSRCRRVGDWQDSAYGRDCERAHPGQGVRKRKTPQSGVFTQRGNSN